MQIRKIISFIFIGLWSAVGADNVQSLDSLKAIVNHTVLTTSEYQHLLKQYQNMRGKPLSVKESREVLDNWIDRTLQLQIAQQQGLTVSDQELEEAIQNVAKSNRLSKPEFLKMVQEHSGISPRAYREEIRKQLLLSRVAYAQFGSSVEVSDKEVEIEFRKHFKVSQLDRYHVVDLYYSKETGSEPELKAIINKLKDQVEKAGNLTEITRIAKEWVVTDLGVGAISEFPQVFRDKLVKLKEGETSPLIQAENGWHWLKVLGLKPAPVEQLKQQIRQQLFQKLMEQKITAWIKVLREQAFIQIN